MQNNVKKVFVSLQKVFAGVQVRRVGLEEGILCLVPKGSLVTMGLVFYHIAALAGACFTKEITMAIRLTSSRDLSAQKINSIGNTGVSSIENYNSIDEHWRLWCSKIEFDRACWSFRF